ncbi:MAG: tail fiber domain-containing protein [Chitinophagales bacterium]|nr:tail fiber domain-containing protein [Chitinophagales bacterium]
MKKCNLLPASIMWILLLGSTQFTIAQSGRVGIGESNPGSKGSIKGNLSVGTNYSGVAAPANGAIIEGQVGIGASAPDVSSALEINSNSKGILIPRMTTSERTAISSPATGLMVYDTSLNQFWYFNGSSWVAAIGPQGPKGDTGAAGATGAQGVKGDTGAQGAVGPQGPTGAAGANGAVGPQGITGPVGCTNTNYVLKSNGSSATCGIMYDNGSGIGIGTVSPSARLHVDGGNIRLAQTSLQAPFELLSYNNSNSLWLMSGDPNQSTIVLSPNYALDWDRGLKITYTPGTTGAGTGDLSIGQTDKNAGTFTHGVTRFFTNGLERVRIDKDGNVGIGATPSQRLDVDGNVRIRGGSPAADMVLTAIDANGNATWKNSVRTKPTTESFTVGGDINTFYPVVFTDAAWDDGPMELDISRSNVHTDASWRGSLQAKFRSHGTQWGHGADFINAEIYYGTQQFIARYEYNQYSTEFIVWLRGGSTTYTTRSNNTTRVTNYTAAAKTLANSVVVNPQTTIESYVVAGGTRLSGNLNITGKFKSNGINETSDSTYKKDIATLKSALDKILELRGVTYKWKADKYPAMNFEGDTQIGLIAQEVEKILPEVVATDAAGMKSIEYSHIVPVLIEAIKKQQSIIETQRQQLNILHTSVENKFAALEVSLQQLQNLLGLKSQK